MSKLETPMTRWYWQQVGGTLIEEFCVVRRSRTCGVRLLDGVIIKVYEQRIARQSMWPNKGAAPNRHLRLGICLGVSVFHTSVRGGRCAWVVRPDSRTMN